MSQEEIPENKDFKLWNDLQNLSWAYLSLFTEGEKKLQQFAQPIVNIMVQGRRRP